MDNKGTSPIEVIQSVLASAFGVQSSKNKERDFSQGRPAHFLIAGIIGTISFILVLLVIVKVVLKTTA
ncbi:MAG: DUF2970 domain-containing protein [Endozoicomonas sp.]